MNLQMKDTMSRCLILLVFSIVLNSALRAQNLDQTVRIADSLYEAGEMDQALRLYRRIAFFDKEEIYDQVTFSRLANGYFQKGDYSNASRYFEFSYNVSEDINYLFDQVLMQILSGNYRMAKLSLLNVFPGKDEEIKARKLALLSMVEFKLENYEVARDYLNRFYAHTPFPDSLGYDIVEKTSRIRKKYKKSKVKAMSLILPGTGQIYCGEVKDGLNSLGVTVLFGYLYFRVWQTLGVVDAFIAVLPWYQKYYVGGYNKAGIIAVAKQEELIGELFNEMVANLESSLARY